ncbi:MAG: holo-[acyl-carrier-protein] synthase [Nitrospinae bacterium CG11_big_fil_rev_8_21_14_0_20_56_8]|nr:MAG: holo-[acyl-carrier-protein] synthase [Nitrospinae bacterium CG11_big_fil_rev_8_21_14_0_20_56_8]
MIFGIGIDIVEIGRIQKSMEKYAERFEGKLFTPEEIEFCRSRSNPVLHFAGRFAVKEAVLKCLGTGMTGGIGWKDLEVVSEPSGRPILRLHGKGKELFESLKLKAIHISISHGQDYAVAQALAEK